MKSLYGLVLAAGLVLGLSGQARAQFGVAVGRGFGGTGVSVVAGNPWFGSAGYGGFGYAPGFGFPGLPYYGAGVPAVAVAPTYVAPTFVAPVTPFVVYRPPVVAPLYPVGFGRPFVGGFPAYGPRPWGPVPFYGPRRWW